MHVYKTVKKKLKVTENNVGSWRHTVTILRIFECLNLCSQFCISRKLPSYMKKEKLLCK